MVASLEYIKEASDKKYGLKTGVMMKPKDEYLA